MPSPSKEGYTSPDDPPASWPLATQFSLPHKLKSWICPCTLHQISDWLNDIIVRAVQMSRRLPSLGTAALAVVWLASHGADVTAVWAVISMPLQYWNSLWVLMNVTVICQGHDVMTRSVKLCAGIPFQCGIDACLQKLWSCKNSCSSLAENKDGTFFPIHCVVL